MIDGYAAIHPHTVGLLMLRGISNTGHFGQAKHCVINALDTNYLLSADEVMANILHRLKAWTRNSKLRACRPMVAPPLESLRLSVLVAALTPDVETAHVSLAAVRGAQQVQHLWQFEPHPIIVHNIGLRPSEVDPSQTQDDHPKVWNP
jgi:hypothetical protein